VSWTNLSWLHLLPARRRSVRNANVASPDAVQLEMGGPGSGFESKRSSMDSKPTATVTVVAGGGVPRSVKTTVVSGVPAHAAAAPDDDEDDEGMDDEDWDAEIAAERKKDGKGGDR